MDTRIYYRDFITEKRHWTRGVFSRWVWDGRIRTFRAVIKRERSILLIPQYLIDRRSLKDLPFTPEKCDHCNELESHEDEIYSCEECAMSICWMCSEEHANGRVCQMCFDDAEVLGAKEHEDDPLPF